MDKNCKKFKDVLNKTPLRVSFGGGGTELPRYFKKFGGCVINTTINLYILTKIQKTKNSRIVFFLGDYGKKCTLKTKTYQRPKDEKFLIHYNVYKIFSEKYLNSTLYPLKISTYSDAPIGSGLGTSSTLTVSLIKALCGFFSINLSKKKIALLAFYIEREKMKLEGGLQDHFAASYGGLNKIEINKKGTVRVKKLKVNKLIITKLKSSMMLVYSGETRSSSKEIKKINSELQEKNSSYLKYLHYQKKNVYKQEKLFTEKNYEKLLLCINKAWSEKNKQIPNNSKKIINMINLIMKAGAKAVKISGAGGGGFLFCLFEPFEFYKIKNILRKNKKNYIMKFSLKEKGSQNIFI